MKYVCSSCESEFLKWSGKCPDCEEWGTFEEIGLGESKHVEVEGKKKSADYKSVLELNKKASSKNVSERLSTGYLELDRVLGGGLVGGAIVLISGEPGVGKSTILLQVALNLISEGRKILYVCGEESPTQLRSRLDRVMIEDLDQRKMKNLFLTDSVDIDEISSLIEKENFDLVIVDSIQSTSSQSSKGFVGSISQVRISGAVLTRVAKKTGTPIFLVGQINKMGNVAGPKILEHIVDCVLYIEGEKFNQYRIVRGMKNRYGSTNEIGVFEMGGSGLKEVVNPSLVFLEDNHKVSGSAIGAILQGSRVVFLEVQALVSEREEGGFTGPLKRVANGIKKPRLDMLCAVLSKRGNCFLGNKDVYVNVVGGLNVSDPAIDLAVCAAIKSTSKDKILDKSTIYFGEVGLTGEVRGSWGLDAVLKESKRVGYKNAIIGRSNIKYKDIDIKKVSFLKGL